MAARRGDPGRTAEPLAAGPIIPAGPVSIRRRCLGLLLLLAPLAAGAQQQQPELKGYWDAIARGDYNAAAAVLRQPADAGDAEAQYRFAMLYAQGLGLRPNDALGASWMRRAADQGHAAAQYELGRMYLAGKGVPDDRREAIAWLTRAANAGHEPATALLQKLRIR